ncbi:hypothetical protein GP486_002432 [Trichoglossum hirsutum]|uniref:Cation efflux protein transmembrane domain-containing protein n=1 Tax=Trichoglossum hirsutum TaxID=265104 RepID=A0A9P8RRP0_9PEZI|nr:hypothetical protein GP486_002432 [Trichoglossum hirsutum]
MTDHFTHSEASSLHEAIQQPPFRIPRPKALFSLHAEDLLTTRGHNLPGLIQSHSSASLHKMGQHYSGRRPSSLFDADTEADLDREERDRRQSAGVLALMTPQMRSMRLIGNSNPRYQWRKYYERTNSLVQQYSYIDRLLDSSLPHDLIQEYQHHQASLAIPGTIFEEPTTPKDGRFNVNAGENGADNGEHFPTVKVKRTPKDIYRVPNEQSPLLAGQDGEGEQQEFPPLAAPSAGFDYEEDVDSGDSIVAVAIYISLAANAILLAAKICVTILTSSLSILASLVDAALDFLSSAIVWTTTRMIARSDSYAYPVGRRRLEPIGVLVYSIVMITAFFQVMVECFQRLVGSDHSIVRLTLPSILIMGSTVIIKFLVWLWCRFIKNSSVQALAQDAMTDVVFNTFSIIFPLIGFYLRIWYLDALGGLLLSLYIIIKWSHTSASHIRNLTGAAATADERNVLLYLTMRFAKTIKQIQCLQAYHAGDKLNVEVDIVLDGEMSLRDSHDLGESLQYVLESVPIVDRAFVHQDYAGYNLPNHMQQA